MKIQYPGIAEALEADLRNMGTIVRLAKALAPGLDPRAIAKELRERVLEELDYEHEADNQRAFSRAYRGHPFIYVPDVLTRLSRRRVLVTEYVDGVEFEAVKELDADARSRFGEIVFRFAFGSIYHLQHFNADTHPGNYLLMPDDRVAFLDFGMTKRLDIEQIELEQAARRRGGAQGPGGVAALARRSGVRQEPDQAGRRALMEAVMIVGGWYLEDREYEVSARRVAKVIEISTDPRSDYFSLLRKETVPADELMGRRMETGVLACLAAATREAQLAPDHAGSGCTRTPRRRSWGNRSGRISRSGA